MHTEAQLRDFLAAQLGLITLDQILSVGATRYLARSRVKSGAWERVLPGVYRDTLVPSSLEQSCLAANLWGGADAVIARRAAGALWELDGLAAPMPELWVPKTANWRVLPVTWDDITDTPDDVFARIVTTLAA